MTHRILKRSVSFLAFLAAIRISVHAEGTNADLIKSAVMENDVLYLRVGSVEKNLANEIQSAQSALAISNKIAGTVLDLRFAKGGDFDTEQTTAKFLASKKSPLAILVNGETIGAAAKLAADLREERAGLIFGGATKELKPDIAVEVKAADEKKFMENPFGTPAQGETNSPASTNDFLSFVDHTSEADLVRAKIKDGDEDENLKPERLTEPQKPFIRDPVLARAVDLIKGLAIVRQSHL
jgi:hypothetical protein